MVRAALVIYLVLLGAIGLWLTAIDAPVRDQVHQLIAWLHARGAPPSLRYGYVEAAANAVVFVPLGFLVALLLQPSRWWVAVLVGMALSAAIELAQLVLLSARTADPIDFAMNTAGALVGAVLGAAVRWVLSRRRAVRSSPKIGGAGPGPR